MSGKIAYPALNETSSKGEITRSLPMIPTITAFERSPDRGRGLARDMRVRWALEEVSQRYEVQRGRPDDGVGALQVKSIGYPGRISEPLRLCRPRRSAARIQARFR